MAEENQNPEQGGNDRQFAIQRIYMKDTSFESPQAPKIFAAEKFAPNISMQLNTDAKPIDQNGAFNVVLTITVEAKQDEETVYLVEVQQAGIFTAAGFPQQELGQMLGGADTAAARANASDLLDRDAEWKRGHAGHAVTSQRA